MNAVLREDGARPPGTQRPMRPVNRVAAGAAFLGSVLVLVLGELGVTMNRAVPVGALEIQTNVGGVEVLVDGQPLPGNGQDFVVYNLSIARRHRVEVRRPAFRTFQQEVPIVAGSTERMQVELAPEMAVPSAPLQTLPPLQPPPVGCL